MKPVFRCYCSNEIPCLLAESGIMARPLALAPCPLYILSDIARNLILKAHHLIYINFTGLDAALKNRGAATLIW